MRVLILSQWFTPEPVQLVLELAQTIRETGHEVEVLTGFPNFPSGRLYPGYRQRPWMRETIGGIRVTRVPLYPDHSRSSKKRILNYMSFAASASLLAPLLMRRPDVVFVYGTPYTAAIPARVLKLLRGVPFVFDVLDLWPDTIAPSGMASPRVLNAVGRFADWVYRQATAIIAVSRGFGQRLVAAGVPPEKVRVISNWADVDDYHPVGIDETFRRELGIEGRFVVLYAGTIGRLQGLDAVIAAAALLRDDDRIRFVFVGDGVDLPHLQEQARTLGLTNALFLGRHPESAMPRMYSLADVLLVHLTPDPLMAMTIPHKIFAYMATAKPILSAVEGDAAAVVAETASGVACQPGQPAAIAEAVRRLAHMSPDERMRMGANGRRAACELYSRQHCAGQIIEVLAEAAAKGRGQ